MTSRVPQLPLSPRALSSQPDSPTSTPRTSLPSPTRTEAGHLGKDVSTVSSPQKSLREQQRHMKLESLRGRSLTQEELVSFNAKSDNGLSRLWSRFKLWAGIGRLAKELKQSKQVLENFDTQHTSYHPNGLIFRKKDLEKAEKQIKRTYDPEWKTFLSSTQVKSLRSEGFTSAGENDSTSTFASPTAPRNDESTQSNYAVDASPTRAQSIVEVKRFDVTKSKPEEVQQLPNERITLFLESDTRTKEERKKLASMMTFDQIKTQIKIFNKSNLTAIDLNVLEILEGEKFRAIWVPPEKK